jgi:hypothetical protein
VDTSDREPYGNPGYYESISVEAFHRSPRRALAGKITVSAETKPPRSIPGTANRSYFFPYVIDLILMDPRRFVGICGELPIFVQDCMFQFYFLGRICTEIAVLLGSNRWTVEKVLRLAEKAVIAKACSAQPEGMREILEEMARLDSHRRLDRGLLRLSGPVALGMFTVKLQSSTFPMFFPPRTSYGLIVRAM